MLVGHYAIGFFGKKLAPKASLAVFVLAAMTADILWCAFMLAGSNMLSSHLDVARGSISRQSTSVSAMVWPWTCYGLFCSL
jgi:hypothetical protein